MKMGGTIAHIQDLCQFHGTSKVGGGVSDLLVFSQDCLTVCARLSKSAFVAEANGLPTSAFSHDPTRPVDCTFFIAAMQHFFFLLTIQIIK